MNYKERRKVRTIHRRILFLEKRISEYYGKNPSRDKQEAAALRWLLKQAELPLPESEDFT